jgi:predicted dienelactone hydrolase
MDAVRRGLSRALTVGVVAAVVAVGLLAQAGAYLFGFATPQGATGPERTAYDGLSHAAPGARPVGVRRLESDDALLEMLVWYPAADSAEEGPAMTYSYGLTVLAPRASTALATYVGIARLGAAPDLATGPHPLVVLSSGFAITPGSYAWLAEHLASHGMVVVAPRHEETLDPGTLWRSAIDRPDVIARTRSAIASAARPGGDLAGLVDPGTVGVLGHSYGGYTALAAGGARPDVDAFTSGCADAREADDPIVFLCDALEPRLDEVVAAGSTRPEPVDAVVSLAGDAAMFGEAGLAPITAPLLVIGGTADHDSPFAWSTRLAYDGVSSTRKVEVALEGAEHFVFSGQCGSVRRIVSLVPMGFCDDPAWDRERARAVIKHYVTGFLLSELVPASRDRVDLEALPAPTGVAVRSTG